MLRHLSIQNFVLIERCELAFASGLNVLTGETGAGKSILLGALGLVLGDRASGQPVREGADKAIVSAEFDLPEMVNAILEENGLDAADESLLIRRVLGADGKGRCFVNDQPVSVALLKQLGEHLVEIHGQHGQAGLHDPALQRVMLDRFAGIEEPVRELSKLFYEWKAALKSLEEVTHAIEQARREEEYLRHVQKELSALAPQPDEETELAEQRALMMKSEKLGGLLQEAMDELQGARPPEQAMQVAQRLLMKSELAETDILQPAIDGLERAQIELNEAITRMEEAVQQHGYDPSVLDQIEERLFALRGAARKHKVTVDELPELLRKIEQSLAGLESQEEQVAACEAQVKQTKMAYISQAKKVSEKRRAAADQLAKRVMNELGPLKMGATQFCVEQEALEESQWQAEGTERIRFTVSTNPGSPFGPLHKIASGGELSRFMLALKVVLAEGKQSTTLIFDEIDTGTSGIVADAIGDRLAALGQAQQVMVITHLPQVASKGQAHFRVAKAQGDTVTETTVTLLDNASRREELAQMLSGKQITEEARQAADKLMKVG